MLEIRRRTILIRTTIFTALVVAGFWTAWRLIGESVPTQGFAAVDLQDVYHAFPAFSRWFDVLLTPLWVVIPLAILTGSAGKKDEKEQKELFHGFLWTSLGMGVLLCGMNTLYSLSSKGLVAAYLSDFSLTTYFAFPVVIVALIGFLLPILTGGNSCGTPMKAYALLSFGGSFVFGVFFGAVAGLGAAMLLFLSASAGAALLYILRNVLNVNLLTRLIDWLSANDVIKPKQQAASCPKSEPPPLETEIRKTCQALQDKLASHDRTKSEVSELERRLAKLEAKLPGGERDARILRQEDIRL